MRDSKLHLHKIAAAFFGIPGCDATTEQLETARKALKYYQAGESIAKIKLLLRIKKIIPPTVFGFSDGA